MLAAPSEVSQGIEVHAGISGNTQKEQLEGASLPHLKGYHLEPSAIDHLRLTCGRLGKMLIGPIIWLSVRRACVMIQDEKGSRGL